MAKLTKERLVEILQYNSETGEFIWKIRHRGGRHSYIAGWVRKGINSYRCICIDGHEYLAHRLAWFYMTGAWPSSRMDHKNLNKSDNRWCNLRLATHSQNLANQKAHSNNTSGYKGVCLEKRYLSWRACIMKDGKQRHLGLFRTPEEAHAAYCAAAVRYFGEYGRGS